MYDYPPLVYQGTRNTSAVANTPVTTNLLPATVGIAYRLMGFAFSSRSTLAIGDRILVTLVDTLATSFFHGSMFIGYYPFESLMFPYPGFQLTPDAGLDLVDQCNAVTKSIGIMIYYYQDFVS